MGENSIWFRWKTLGGNGAAKGLDNNSYCRCACGYAPAFGRAVKELPRPATQGCRPGLKVVTPYGLGWRLSTASSAGKTMRQSVRQH